MKINKKIGLLLEKIREKGPLVHHLTNYVTVNDCANITLAIGASPVMADDINEVKDMVSLASSLVINIGTLNSRTVESMLAAGKKANERGIPVILDPVGAGATPYRTEVAKKILGDIKLSVIRGNISEIKALCGLDSVTKGVDAAEAISHDKDKISAEMDFARKAAKKLKAVIAITGAIDIITNGESLYTVENGHKIMSRVTGTGCMCSSLIGSCLGTGEDILTAALSGVAAMGIAGEVAYEKVKEKNLGTGSLKVYIIDEIFKINKETIIKRGKIYEQ
ncbi:MAG: hydroxyethylthiazole kinase [Clostridiaceae bacterium]